MKKLYAKFFIPLIAILLAMPSVSTAQRGPNKSEATNKRTKVVRGCEYEIVPGLAEITSIKKKQSKDESILEYDEHEVWFRFTAMEGDELIDQVKDTEIEFVLRSSNLRIPVGPEYIETYKVKKGTRYAMNLLQTNDREACPGELFTYESKALRNDLFEADRGDALYRYKKERYRKKQENKEKEYNDNKDKEKEEEINNETSPIDDARTDEADIAIAKNENLDDLTDLTEAELIALAEAEVIADLEDGGTSSSSLPAINEEEMREKSRAKYRKKYAEELASAGKTLSAKEQPNGTAKNTGNNTIREAKRKAREKDRKKKEAAKRNKDAKEAMSKKRAELQQKIDEEVEKEIKKEIELKRLAAQKSNEEEAKTERDELNKKIKAIEKKNAIKKAIKERIVNETKRKSCTFSDRISGIIEIIKVSKAKEAGQSILGHNEYEVVVTFRPDNFVDLSKKDKKQWEALNTFTLDPMGKNANPGAGYIRKYKVFKGSQYKGFAQLKVSGICLGMMVYSPDLPNDVSKIKLK